MSSRFLALALPLLFSLPGVLVAEEYTTELPVYLRDRGASMPTSMFGTYIQKGEFLLYPFWEYYYNPDEEYKPAELGYGVDQDFTSEFRANESLIFACYGFTDRFNVELEAAHISAELNKAPNDFSAMPDDLEEQGLGDVQTMLNYMWRHETPRGLGAFSFFETVYPFNKNKPLTGTSDFELKLGQGVIKGYSWGTMKARITGEYILAEKKAELGEVAVEYLKRVHRNWRVAMAVEGFQDEIELISEVQYHLIKDRLYMKFNNATGLTSKAPDWAPEYGIMIGF